MTELSYCSCASSDDGAGNDNDDSGHYCLVGLLVLIILMIDSTSSSTTMTVGTITIKLLITIAYMLMSSGTYSHNSHDSTNMKKYDDDSLDDR
jgi:hypothetical protein